MFLLAVTAEAPGQRGTVFCCFPIFTKERFVKYICFNSNLFFFFLSLSFLHVGKQQKF